MTARYEGFVPGIFAIDAYGGGGFRFADMSHRGSIMALPAGIFAWKPEVPADIDVASLHQLFESPDGSIEFLLLGTGVTLVPPSDPLRLRLRQAGIGVEAMATGAAVRTYNVLLGERRPVAAAPSGGRVSLRTDAAQAGFYAECEAAVREHDRDRWLASLFAPAAVRPHLCALYAFNYEIARVRDIVSDPLPGEMRFQWWADALAGTARADVAAHPVAAALFETMERFNLPREALLRLIEARRFDLYDDPMPSLADLEGYCGDTSSALMRLASIVLADGADPGGAAAAGHAGVAYAITGLLRALPWHAARGQIYVPADVLDRHGAKVQDILAGRMTPQLAATLTEMRACVRSHRAAALPECGAMEQGARASLLPLALVEPYLRRMERRDYDVFKTPAELPQWRRQWALWRGAREMSVGGK